MNAFLDLPRNLPLSRYECFRHNDVAAIQDHVSQVIERHDLFGSGRRANGEFRHCVMDLGGVSLDVMSYDFDNEHFVIDCPIMGDDYRIQFSLSGAGQFDDQKGQYTFDPSRLVLLHPHATFKETISSNYRHLMVRFKHTTLERAYINWTGRQLHRPLRFDGTVIDIGPSALSLINYLKMLCYEYENEHTLYRSENIRHSAGDLLVQLALTSLHHNYSDELEKKPAKLAPYYVCRVEEYINARLREDISMSDLVDVAGCSARAVYNSFHKYRDTSPMQYLRERRLSLCREELLNVGNTGKNVTTIATECGFTNMSKFAELYKSAFGELPSQTRKQSIYK